MENNRPIPYEDMIAAVGEENAIDNQRLATLREDIEKLEATINLRISLIEDWKRKSGYAKHMTVKTTEPLVTAIKSRRKRGRPARPAPNFVSLFAPNEFVGTSQTGALTLIAGKITAMGRNQDVFGVADVLSLLEHVGSPIGGETDYNRNQNTSKLLRRHKDIISVDKGRYRFGRVESPKSENPTAQHEPTERGALNQTMQSDLMSEVSTEESNGYFENRSLNLPLQELRETSVEPNLHN